MTIAGPDVSPATYLRVARTAGGFAARTFDFGWGDAFGGDLLARAALAALDGAGPKRLHALHGHFLRRVPAGAEVVLVVTPLGDGERVAQRRVEVRHDGALACEVVASLAVDEDGPDFPPAPLDASLAPPASLASDVELARAEGWPEASLCGVEWRRIRPTRWPFPPFDPAHPEPWSGWFRPRAPLPDDAALHAALLVFASDLLSHTGVERRLRDSFRPGGFATLDHALWIHEHRRWNDWWLVETVCEVGRAGRALTRRTIAARDGARIATVMQEQRVE